MWNILRRELLEMSRRRGSHAPRWVAAGLLMGGFAWAWWSLRILPNQAGPGLFGLLGRCTVLLIWLGAPLMTADVIARERREGTLGLLWLTPLTPGQVILAKTAAEALRAGVMLMATVPVMVLPMLLGGVGWPEVIRLVLMAGAALALALASGVAASAIWRGWLTVRLGAVGMNMLALFLFVLGHQLTWAIPQWRQLMAAGLETGLVEILLRRLTQGLQQVHATWRILDRGILPFHPPVSWVAVMRAGWLAIACGGLAIATSWMAAWALKRAMAREAGAEPGPNRWEARWHRLMKWSPAVIGVAWVLAAAVDWPTVDFLRDLGWVANGWIGMLAVMAGVGWIHRERRLGSWELLAVIPGGAVERIRERWKESAVWLISGWGLLALAHGIGIAAVRLDAARYPWWLPGWLMGQALEGVVLAWAGCWWGACLGIRIRRTGLAVLLGGVGLWLAGRFAQEIVGWGLGHWDMQWTGALAEPWPTPRGKELRGVDVLGGWLAGLTMWCVLGAVGRWRVLRTAREPQGLG